jgi:hypothetical protein
MVLFPRDLPIKGCLEKKLGRKVTRWDFARQCPNYAWMMPESNRLLSRLQLAPIKDQLMIIQTKWEW